MTDTNTASVPEPVAPLPGLLTRIVMVLTSPKALFERLSRTPKTAAMMWLVAVLIGIGSSAFLLTERGHQAWLDTTVEQTERRSGQPINAQQEQAFEKAAPYVGYGYLVAGTLFTPLGVLVEAGILYLIFTFGTGGTATFKQVMAVVAHTGIISVLLIAFTTIMQFVQGTYSTAAVSPANLGALVPMLEPGWLTRFLGFVDVFRVWSIVTLSIGLGVVYRKKTRNIAITLLVLYGVILAVVATIFT